MIHGRVDDYGRALTEITVRHPLTGISQNLEAWIDTAFTGKLSLTPAQIASLGLGRSAAVSGNLADDSITLFETYTCVVHWFDQDHSVDAIAGPKKFALLGVGLLEDCALFIDYPARTVEIKLLPEARNGP